MIRITSKSLDLTCLFQAEYALSIFTPGICINIALAHIRLLYYMAFKFPPYHINSICIFMYFSTRRILKILIYIYNCV